MGGSLTCYSSRSGGVCNLSVSRPRRLRAFFAPPLCWCRVLARRKFDVKAPHLSSLSPPPTLGFVKSSLPCGSESGTAARRASVGCLLPGYPPPFHSLFLDAHVDRGCFQLLSVSFQSNLSSYKPKQNYPENISISICFPLSSSLFVLLGSLKVEQCRVEDTRGSEEVSERRARTGTGTRTKTSGTTNIARKHGRKELVQLSVVPVHREFQCPVKNG